MKKLVLTLVVGIATLVYAHAQNVNNEVKVKVNLELNPFQSITIGSGATPNGNYGDQVTLRYSNAEDYRNGVEQTVLNQLLVSSVGSGFNISATFKSSGNATTTFIPGTNAGTEPINIADILDIKVDNLSGNGTPLNYRFDGATPVSSIIDRSLAVKYIGKAITSQTMLGKLFASNSQANYSVDVIYTIAAN
ncbi:hypothetical protein ACFRAE_12530 [Sphingobacterium sp. HJSM2_6]|uniref:hypothetical protein n=1 Tax=Sphingobacterium sp. HJSM2_6 TaxID=3366264 RepID=UPI003BE4761E